MAQSEDGGAPVRFKHLNTIIAALVKQVREHVSQRTTALEDRIHYLESRKSVEYCGTWKAEREYGANDLATYGGTLWICRAQGTRKKPGDGDAWQLCSKRDLEP